MTVMTRQSKAETEARLLAALGMTKDQMDEALARMCNCCHNQHDVESVVGHEFVPLNHRWIGCTADATWRGIWTCDSEHAHLTQVCDPCQTAHEADAEGDGVPVLWEQIAGFRPRW